MTAEAVAQPLGLPLRQDDPLSLALMIKIMLVMVLLLALVYIVMRWYARRHNGGMPAIAVSELHCGRALRLSSKTKVYLVQTETAQVLVTESSNGATVTLLPVNSPSACTDALP